MQQRARMGSPWQVHGAAMLLAALNAAALAQVNTHIVSNYMDEPFHVPQTQRYCQSDFTSWDPKITTLPGLYIIGTIYAWAAAAAQSMFGYGSTDAMLELTCSTSWLRCVNTILSVACFYTIYATIQALTSEQQDESQGGSKHRGAGSTRAVLLSLAVSLYPLHWFYSFLYYTDVGSLLLVLVCQLCSLKGRYGAAATAGAAAVLFRQTNAIWVAFVLGTAALRIVKQLGQQQPGQEGKAEMVCEGDVCYLRRPAAVQACPDTSGPLHRELTTTLNALWAHRAALIRSLWPLTLVPAAFVVFLYLNGGVTVGDKAAHQPVKNPSQLVLFSLHALAMLAPACLFTSGPRLMRMVVTRPSQALIPAAILLMACFYSMRLSPPPHPYLLADNRHYTFYIWRRLVSRHAAVGKAVLPAAGAAAWAVLAHAVLRRQSRVWTLGLVACTALVLVPAWLLELRYYTVPLVMLALHMPLPSSRAALVMVALYSMVNAATLYLFLHRPFTWADGSVARFMW